MAAECETFLSAVSIGPLRQLRSLLRDRAFRVGIALVSPGQPGSPAMFYPANVLSFPCPRAGDYLRNRREMCLATCS